MPAIRRIHPVPPAALGLVLGLLGLAGCDHGSSFQFQTTSLGPRDTALPRRLTFFTGDDRTPSVSADLVVFSRQSDAEPGAYGATGREACIALLPVEGGTIRQTLCPHRLIPEPDTLVDTWYEPVLSPDGSLVAFMWQRGLRVSALGFVDAYLTVAPFDDPADTARARYQVTFSLPGQNPQRANVATRITWVDADHLRFLATEEAIDKVKGGGSARVTDTAYLPLALMELDLATRTATLLPGGDSVVAYAAAPDGGIWLVRMADRTALLHLDPSTGAMTPVGAFSSAVSELAVVNGLPVAVVDIDSARAIERLDPATGERFLLAGIFAGRVLRLAPAGGRRLVVEVEQATVPFGAPSDLWLIELP